jgi:hypothetical protein
VAEGILNFYKRSFRPISKILYAYIIGCGEKVIKEGIKDVLQNENGVSCRAGYNRVVAV